jgi:predicted metalloenzyme YecM
LTDPIADIIGNYRAFASQQRDRLLARGIDIAPYTLSHLAYRVPEWDQYVDVRTRLERHATANRENVWNGRPISLIVPAEPLDVLQGKAVPLIEAHPARPPARVQDGPGAPRGRGRRRVRLVR